MKRQFVHRMFSCLVILAIISPDCSSKKTICRVVNYAGWPDAVEMSNATVRVVVAPSVGRIIHYGFTGKDNVLWVNPRFAGKTLSNGELIHEDGRAIWANFGGDKVWPTAQSLFRQFNDRSWPPDVVFDGGQQTVKFLPDGVRLTSSVSPAVGARLVREIHLPGEDSRIVIVQRIEKVDTNRIHHNEPVPLTIWNTTQIQTPLEMIFNRIATKDFPNGYYIAPISAVSEKNLSLADGIGILHPDSTKSQKVSAISNNWVAAIVEQTVFAEFFMFDSTANYPDGNLNCKVYSSSTYAQLEVASPQKNLLPGEQLEFTIAWELFALPDSVMTTEAKQVEALNWLAGKKL